MRSQFFYTAHLFLAMSLYSVIKLPWSMVIARSPPITLALIS